MIMVLSCCDLLTVITNILGLILYLIAWLTENHDLYTTVIIYIDLNKLSAGFSMSTLMVMCIERYLGVYHPFFHKTSVTRHKLLTFLAILIILPATLIIVSTNDLVLSRPIALGIFMVAFVPLFIFFNYKLLKISRKMRRENTTPTEKRRINLKNIHTCLLTVVCLLVFSIPTSFRIAFAFVEGSTSDNAWLSLFWVSTMQVMNCSFNSLIFFWKNKVLRDEGIKIVKKM